MLTNMLTVSPTLDEIVQATIEGLEDNKGILLSLTLTAEVVDWCRCRGRCSCQEIVEGFLTLGFVARFDHQGNQSVGGGRSQIGSWDTVGGWVKDWRDSEWMRSEVPEAIAEILNAEGIRRADIVTALNAIVTADRWEIPAGF